MRHSIRTALAALLASTLLTPGVTLASVGLLSRSDDVSALRGFIGGALRDESNSTQLLGEVTNEASVAAGNGPDDDRVAIAMTSTVTEQAGGFTASIDRLAVDYLITTLDAGATYEADFEVTFRVETAADYRLSFGDSRADFPFTFSAVGLQVTGGGPTDPNEFSQVDFFSDQSLGLVSPIVGRLGPGDYTFGAGALDIPLNTLISDDLPPPRIADAGEILDAFVFTVTAVPEPSAALLAVLMCLAGAAPQRKRADASASCLSRVARTVGRS